MNRLLIENGLIVNDNQRFNGYLLIDGERITEVGHGEFGGIRPDRVIDAKGRLVMPGVIDDQVHFRDPGMTYKADIHTESVAAVAGGVTSYMEMPNTNPATITVDLLNQKLDIAAEKSVANYSFYFGATNDNLNEIKKLDTKRVCGLKIFMGSSTGNLLVDNDKSLAAIFAESPILVATHCESDYVVKANMERFKAQYGDKLTTAMHPLIRSEEACYLSTAKAVELADKYETNLHVLHLSTARELTLFDAKPLKDKKITNEVCLHHLWFNDSFYAEKGNFIKWNPSIKTEKDRLELIAGLNNGKVDVVATDHAPHTLEEKNRPYVDAPSGGPLVQHSLTGMLELSKKGCFTIEKVIEKMCHAPADRFAVEDRGYLKSGYFADVVIVDLDDKWTVSADNILYKCGWSPFTGTEFTSKVAYTIVNGVIAYENGIVDKSLRGKELSFKR